MQQSRSNVTSHAEDIEWMFPVQLVAVQEPLSLYNPLHTIHMSLAAAVSISVIRVPVAS